MDPPGGIASGASALTRRRLAVLIAAAMLALGVAAGASASRIQVKPSHALALTFSGHDWLGKARVTYSEFSGDSNRGDVFTLYGLTFANLCSRRGSVLNQSITIRRDNRFHYHGHGFTVTGNVIGRRAAPKEIAGLATVSRHGCTSGPWWFEVKPTER